MARLLALLTLMLACAPAFASDPEKPKLVVLVVFDQMRGDYLQKWQRHFGADGFARLHQEGAWYVNCHYPYAITLTGPGHSSILTGCGPDVHGIIANTWYDRKTGAVVNCSESERYQRVPEIAKDLPKDVLRDEFKEAEPPEAKPAETAPAKATPKSNGTPDRLLAPTFSESLKASNGKSRAFGLSFKDRSAVLPTGPKADGAYWFDNADGMVVTSTFYRDTVHPWVAEFNKRRPADAWFDRPWERLRADVDYQQFSGPDNAFGEGSGARQGVVFPHPLNGGLKRAGKVYYEALYNSPFGNEFLLELVKTAVVAEKIGQGEHPDLLSVSFSSNDAVGHCWGPDSQEMLDTTLRSDRMMAGFLKFLDDTVGKGKYLLCLTADHGICPIPEVSAAKGMDAKRADIRRSILNAEMYLCDVFEGDPRTKTRWIENYTYPWVHFNYKVIEAKGLKPATVARTFADYLARHEGVHRTFTRADLEREQDPYDTIGKRMKKAYHPERSGDVGVVLKPYYLEWDPKYPTGTTHGSPWPYDTHVPLIVFGPNVKPGIRREEVVPATIASIFAKALDVPPPAKAEYPAPDGLFIKRP